MEENIRKALNLPRNVKRALVLLLDISLCAIAVLLSFYLRLGDFGYLANAAFAPEIAYYVSVSLAIPIFLLSGFYTAVFRYYGGSSLKVFFLSILSYGATYSICFTVIGFDGVPRTIGILQPIILLLLVSGSRVVASKLLCKLQNTGHDKSPKNRILVFGAGKSGQRLAASLLSNREMNVVAFADDQKGLIGSSINRIPIVSAELIEEAIAKFRISDVVMAIPHESRQRRNEILLKLQKINVSVRSLPSFTNSFDEDFNLPNLNELDIDDLLGRKEVVPKNDLLSKNIFDKVIMVTGAGGSIGSELCRQILRQSPKILILIDQSEYALYQIHQELELISDGMGLNKTIKIIPLLTSVLDETRMSDIFNSWRPNCIYHAAAYKHVPLVEHNSIEGVRNNVFGTYITASLARKFGANHFVLISTDKAVRPTNIMGASKRISELILQAFADNSLETSTIFCMVRFGNVLGSSGSVVPKFRQQIKFGGPITLTHPEVTRYFMTVTEASQLVLQASAMAEGGEVFLLDMAEPVKIIDLAQRMIQLSGLRVKNQANPDGDIEIKITGLRPGEKLYEELLIGENSAQTAHHRIMKSLEEFVPEPIFLEKIACLEKIINERDYASLSEFLQKTVSGYISGDIVDFVYLNQ